MHNKQKKFLPIFLPTLLLTFFQSFSQDICIPVNLKCEYLVNPIGIDAVHPRFTWMMEDKRQGAKQIAYEVQVDTDSLALKKGVGKSWTTGRVDSSSQLLPYYGQPLKPFTRYFWTVYVWDKNNKRSMPAPVASFETGMMGEHNWKGSWISDSRDITQKSAPYFRKQFNNSKKIKSARAYIAVAGLYELYINGERVGNHRLDPAFTRFDRSILYVTHDVTTLVKSGANAIGILLGNGWYNHQSTAVWYFHQAPWRARPAFCFDLRITYDDGSVNTIVSDKDWKTSHGGLIFNSIYTAEHYDARREPQGWNTNSFQDSSWRSSELRPAPSQHIVSQAMHPIRNVEEITAKDFKVINDSIYIFDLGRNISGVSQFTVQGTAGTTIRMKHGERLDSNGFVDLSNIDVHYRPIDLSDPFQTDIFILRGDGVESFIPKFNYKGFQFVEITADKPINIAKNSLKGFFMHSDVPVAGKIKSSNPVIDRIWWATNNSYLSNLFGYPTDCPQREKNGWTGDAHIAIETGLYNFDGITIYEKWMADHRDEQQPNGVLPAIIPTSGWGYQWANGPDWTSTIAIIPWNIYLFYGDKKILEDCYDNIKKYVDHIDYLSPTGLTSWGLGDWVPVKSKSPVELTSSIYYYVDALILSKAARLLGKPGDYKNYQALSEKIKLAINNKYLDKESGIYGSGLQTELSVPLYWGLVPDDLKSKVAANLARKVEENNYFIDVGILGAKAILNALSDNGYANTAYKLAAQQKYPSWGWWIVNGATTLYENWKIDARHDISLNHIMFGDIGAWFYRTLGGIKPDPVSPGFKHIFIQPNFVDSLDYFEAEFKGPYGTIRSSWKRSGNISYSIEIPANSSATVSLPISPGQRWFQNGKPMSNVTTEVKKVGPIRKIVFKIPAGSYNYELK